MLKEPPHQAWIDRTAHITRASVTAKQNHTRGRLIFEAHSGQCITQAADGEGESAIRTPLRIGTLAAPRPCRTIRLWLFGPAQ